MSHPTYPRPPEPLVAQNSFRGRSYSGPPIPTFAEVRNLLPAPVLPDRPEWEEMYWRAWEIAWSNLRRPKAASGFIANFIDPAFNDNTFLWDTCLMTRFGVYGRRAFDFMGSLDNFYAKQHDDGFICREINTQEGYDFFYPFDPNATGPNILAWTEWRYYRATGDDGRLAAVFWPLMAYHRWLRANRTWPNGLYWATGLSSGMDNQSRVPDGAHHHHHWTWVDTNMQAALDCLALQKIAEYVGARDFIPELSQERSHLHHEINARLWHNDREFYLDADASGRHSPVKSIGAYWALLDPELIPADRLPGFLRHLRDVNSFKRPHRVPAQAADDEGYDCNTGGYWRGGVWSPTNFMLLKGLRVQGQSTLAHEIAVNHLDNVAAVYQRTDTFWENYAPETAAPGQPARPDFVGWTGLTPIAILLEDAVGLKVDWPQRQVTWDRRLAAPGGYGISRYPLGSDGRLDLFGDPQQIVITTNVPFNLQVNDGDVTIRKAISVGETILPLS